MSAGRPKKYTKKSLTDAVEDYFRSISCTTTAKKLGGEEIINGNGEAIQVVHYIVPPSVTGLCLKLGIDRSTWGNYADDDKLRPVIENARARIEAYLEEQLLTREKSLQGIIFNLQNNYGWKQKQELELGSETRKTMKEESMSIKEKMALIQEVAALREQDTEGGEAD